MTKCKHEYCEAGVEVIRNVSISAPQVASGADAIETIDFSAKLNVKCKACGTVFRFWETKHSPGSDMAVIEMEPIE